MYKLVILLCLCVYVINCSHLKCDLNLEKITDLQTGKEHNKADFCKDKNCVFRMSRKPDDMIVKYETRREYQSWEWAANHTGKILDVSVYKSDFSKSEKNISDFTYVGLNKTMKQMINQSCFEKNEQQPISHGDYSFLEDGSLWLQKESKKAVLRPQEFIVEFRVRRLYNQWIGPEIIYIKFAKVDTFYYQSIGMLISCFFLILVLVVFCIIKQFRGHYGKLLMTYIACFTATYALAATQHQVMKNRLFNDIHCKIFSPIMYFISLTTFFWLNVLSYEIWNTFRPKNNYRSPQSREHDHSFLKAALYAVGVPLLLVVVALIIDELKPSIKYGPDFVTCMYSSDARLFFYNIPVAILLCANMIFFVMTSYHLWQRKAGKILLNTDSSITRRDENKFGLYIRLSMSTGAYWILELMLINLELPYAIEYVLQTVLALIGVLLFVLLVCNKKVLKEMSKRFGINNRFVNQSSITATSTQDSKKKWSMKKKKSIEPNL